MNLFSRKPIAQLLAEGENPSGLKRALGSGDLIMLAIGAVIGAGIFGSIGSAAAGQTDAAGHVIRLGAGPALVLSFLLLGAACGLAGLCYAELASMIPQAGSAYAYTYATLGEFVAWIIGWDLILEYAVGNVAVAISWGDYFKSLFNGWVTFPPWLTTGYRTALLSSDPNVHGLIASAPHVGPVPIRINVPAFSIVMFITWLLLLGVRESTRANNIMVAVKLIVLALFIVMGLQHINTANYHPSRGTGGRERRVTRFNARARVLTGLALTAGLVTYGVDIPAATASTSTVRITLGGGTDFTDAVIYYADNLLRSEGITVQLSNLADPASALQSVVAGSSDIYLGDPVESAIAVANAGANLKYIATIAQTTDYVILALPKITMSNVSGATMGSAGPGTAGTTIALAAFKKLGIDPTTIKTVTVGGTSARVTAILAGQVDLAAAHAASAVSAVETGKVKILLNAGAVMGQYLQQGLTVNGSFLRDNRALVQSVVNAYLTANRWASTNGPGFIKVANDNKLTGKLTDAQELAAWQQLQSSNFYAVDGAVDQDSINPTFAYSYASGGSLTPATTPAYLKWVDPSFVGKYLLANGFNEAKVVVSQIAGTAVRGKAVRIRALGAFFYGKPLVTSNATGTIVRVVKVQDGALDLTMTTPAKTAMGAYLLTFRFAQGQVVKFEYKVG